MHVKSDKLNNYTLHTLIRILMFFMAVVNAFWDSFLRATLSDSIILAILFPQLSAYAVQLFICKIIMAWFNDSKFKIASYQRHVNQKPDY
jgi:hypothetical protein